MKLFNSKVALLAALFCLSLLGTGCPEDPPATNPGGNGPAPGFSGGVVVPLPGGGAQVSFQGSNVYRGTTILSGGNLSMGNAPQCGAYCFCGTFTGSGFGGTQACWYFSNTSHQSIYGGPGAGTVFPAAVGLPAPGSPGTTMYVGTSAVEPGATVTIVATAGSDGSHANLVGTITLPPNFVTRNFPGGIPSFIELAIDFGISTQNGSGYFPIQGGVLLHTSKESNGAYHGKFLSI